MKAVRKDLFIGLVLGLLVLVGPVQGAELPVPGQYATIQEAIDAASDGDTVIAAPGRYVENIDYKGKAITVRSDEPSDWEVVEYTIIDGSEGGSCVVFDKGEGRTSILDGITLSRGTGGWADYHDRSLGRPPVHAGGGILCVDSSPTIRRCIIRDNGVEDSAPHGGGMALLGDCKAMISNCIIVHNRGGGYISSIGCGILTRTKNPETAISTIRNCTIAHNRPDSWDDWTYQVNCSNTRTRICNTIIWNEACEGHPDCENYYGGGHTRSLLMKDVMSVTYNVKSVTYSCVKNAYTYTEDERYAERIDLTLFGGNIDEWPVFVGPYIESYPNEADYHLVSNSACVNAGDPNFVSEADEMDIDGQARVMGGRIDIGADEVVPEIVVISPTAGDIWTAGSLHVVEWSSYGAGMVDILLSVDGGGSWKTVESGVVDNGIYLWDISASINSDQCVISVVPNPADANVVTVDSGVFSVWPYHGPASLPPRWGWRSDAGERYGPEYGCVKWKFETDGPVTAAVTVGREIKKTTKVYIACEDGKLYTLDADTGALLWSYDTNSPLSGSAAEGREGTVYVGSEGGKLYAINKEGRLLWTHTTGGPIHSTPAVTPNGRIYVSSIDGLIYALLRDGSELWRFETDGFAALGGSVFVSPQETAGGSVYIAGLYDPNLYALSREDRSLKWTCNFEFVIDPCDPNSGTRAGWPFAAPAVGPDGTVYQTLLYDLHLYAIDAGTGGIIWSVDLADPCSGWFEANDLATLRYSDGWSSPVVGPDGTIYVSLDDPYLRAVDPNGTIKWMTKLGELGGFTLTVGSNGLIYAASDDNNLYVVNTEGAEIAQFEGEGWLSHPVIGADGTLYVSDANNAVWAISEEACDGETPVLNGAGKAKPQKPVRFKGRQVHKSNADLKIKKGN